MPFLLIGPPMIRRAALLTLLTALLAPASMVGTAVAVPAVAAAPADPLTVEQITPDVPREPGTPVTISGTVTGTPLASVRVRVWYTPGRPFRLRSEMATFLNDQGYLTTRYSTKIQATQLDQSGKLRFQFGVTPQELSMTQAGVYPLAIEVVDAATEQRLAIKRTVLPYAPKDAQIPKIRLAVALPITDRPHRADDAVFMDDDLRSSVSSGRLAALLKLAQGVGKEVTWFVDPALLEEVRQMSAGGYTVKSGGGTRSVPADPAAGKWLADLRTALADNPVVATPYADPDLTGLVHQGLGGMDGLVVAAVQRGASTASELLGREVDTSIVWPVGGRLDRDALDELGMSGVKSVLLSGEALPAGAAGQTAPAPGAPAGPAQQTPEAAVRLDTVAEDPITGLLADPVLSQTLSTGVSGAEGALLARQRFLGETAMLAFEQPAQPGQTPPAGQTAQLGARTQSTATVRTVVAMPDRRRWVPQAAFLSSLLQSTANAPWVRMTPLESVKARRAPQSDLVYTEHDRQAELRRTYLGTVRRLEQLADAAGTVTAEHTQLFHEAILRLTSVAWRDDRKRAHAFAKQVESVIKARLAQVSVIDTPRTVAGADGQVPVSVTNGLDKDIAIRIRVTSADTSRLTIDVPGGVYETDRITVLRDRSQLLNVPVKVPGGGGEASIVIQLLTAEGKRYGDPVRVTVRATDYTGIAGVIVGSALTIMLAAVVMRILRRRKKKSFPSGPVKPGQAAAVPAEQGERPPA